MAVGVGVGHDHVLSEDDLQTFEEWLTLQRVDAATTPTEELARWRDTFQQIRRELAAIPKIGRMNLPPLGPGEYHYAVAIRDESGLWLTLWIRRSPDGDVFVLLPREEAPRSKKTLPPWNPHTSYHSDGTFHIKSYNGGVLSERRQALNGDFKCVEDLGILAGHGTSMGAICDPKDFSEVIEVAPGILGARSGAVASYLVEPGFEPPAVPMFRVEISRTFQDATPWLVVRVGRWEIGDP